jgi:hypothetical protein
MTVGGIKVILMNSKKIKICSFVSQTHQNTHLPTVHANCTQTPHSRGRDTRNTAVTCFDFIINSLPKMSSVPVVYPRIFFFGGGVLKIQLRTEGG